MNLKKKLVFTLTVYQHTINRYFVSSISNLFDFKICQGKTNFSVKVPSSFVGCEVFVALSFLLYVFNPFIELYFLKI